MKTGLRSLVSAEVRVGKHLSYSIASRIKRIRISQPMLILDFYC